MYVDFNAWEYAASDELWAGCVRELYRKVEARIQKGAGDDDDKQDFKKKWRVKQAVRALKKKYGLMGLRARLSLLVLSALGGLAVVILEAAGLLHVVRAARESVASLVGAALGVVAVLATTVPSARLVAASNHESNTSRGEAIFDEAKTVKDHLGFMSKVKHELDELFEFLDDFEKETKQPLVIVLFVDDLDRCLGGRNVRVLEAYGPGR